MERQEVATSSQTHVLVFPFIAQGHINPLVQFSKRLASKGLKVTLVATHKSMQSQDSSIKVERISDFFEDSDHMINNVESFFDRLRIAVSRGLPDLIEKQNSLGCPGKIVVYDSTMPWVLDIAHQLGLYGAVFHTQSCAVGAVYYHMHKGSLKIDPAEASTVSVPSMPLMETKDLPSFIYDMGSYPSTLRLVLNQFSNWKKADWRLFNTFDKLEGESCAVSAIYLPYMSQGSLEIGSLEGENVLLPSMPLMGVKDLPSFISDMDMDSYPALLRLVDEKGTIRREEIELCLREAMEGERGSELKRNAVRWKEFAKEAVGEGHINPMVHFSKRLASKGLKVTLVATNSSMQLQDSSIQIEHISDCFEEGGQKTDSHDAMFDHFRIAVSHGFHELIEKQKRSGCPVKLVVYDSIMPWVLDTAHQLGLYGATFFTQSCAVSTIYYHEHQRLLQIDPSEGSSVSMPSMPSLGTKDLPSFIYDVSSYPSILRLVVNQFSNYKEADWRLFNTFDKLEAEVCFSFSPSYL
ncbi:hypothetical protein RJ639_045461 [Escallonia herrerae]|uniref:Glycosyltransferase N-terminal domain-containing protein n=1 Tax=Escallonia herrerae TaxID=1293975 RepID=A0AA88W4J0_9ASTE|nr:hypothetical protein RJ639_045461 [Escallonia herrerae]